MISVVLQAWEYVEVLFTFGTALVLAVEALVYDGPVSCMSVGEV